nr:uncharacterized protein LOC109986333 isoform X1 [Labrus bergylta]
MSARFGAVMMAWVWVSLLALARLSTEQEPHRDAVRGPAGPQVLTSDSEPQDETRIGRRFYPEPVWRFVEASQRSGEGSVLNIGRPQYRCSDRTLSVRFSLVRHLALSLEDGKRLLSLPDECRGSARTFGPWLMLRIPYISCHIGSWDSIFEMIYGDLAGEMFTMLAACFNAAPLIMRARHPSAYQEIDLFELWDFEAIPIEPFNPEAQTASTTETPATSSTAASTTSTTPASTTSTTVPPRPQPTEPSIQRRQRVVKALL